MFINSGCHGSFHLSLISSGHTYSVTLFLIVWSSVPRPWRCPSPFQFISFQHCVTFLSYQEFLGGLHCRERINPGLGLQEGESVPHGSGAMKSLLRGALQLGPWTLPRPSGLLRWGSLPSMNFNLTFVS